MRTNLLIVLLNFCFCVLFSLSTEAQTNEGLAGNATNTFSLSPNDFHDWSGQEESYYYSSLLKHVLLPETLPACEDTNDMWGSETNGLLLSIRFRKGRYSLGEAIPAITILRNLETNSRTLLVTDSPSAFFTFKVRSGTNEFLPERKRSTKLPRGAFESRIAPPQGLVSGTWGPRSETEFVINLNNIFELHQPGEYTARALCRVYSPTTKSVLYEVESGSASFTLVNTNNSP